MNPLNGTRVLLISNSTLYGSGYLDHAESEILDFLGKVRKLLFVPFALYDCDAYACDGATNASTRWVMGWSRFTQPMTLKKP